MTATSTRRDPAPGRVDQTTRELLELLGGPTNIEQFAYCFTKLRLSLVSRAAVNDAALLAHPAVMGLIEHQTYQVMLGPAVVEPVANALYALLQDHAE